MKRHNKNKPIFTDEDFEKELAQDADRENALEMLEGLKDRREDL